MQRILIIDDEDDICQILAYSLRSAGYEVDVVHSAEEAISRVRTCAYNLLLMDVMMEGMSGMQLASYLRTHDLLTMPIIFLTALGSEKDVLQGFSLGADDYITKPFRITEVLARVGAVLKRAARYEEPKVASTSLVFKGIEVSMKDKSLRVDGQMVPITRKELDLLCFLLNHQEQLFSRAQLLSAIWHDDAYVLERTVDVHITHLRRKIAPYSDHLQTKSGYGYIWRA